MNVDSNARPSNHLFPWKWKLTDGFPAPGIKSNGLKVFGTFVCGGGSAMGDGVTGGGLHGKDLSKADVSVNIWCHLKAQQLGHVVTACCAIGDDNINGIPYAEIVEEAGRYIKAIGGFEKFAEWGLIR